VIQATTFFDSLRERGHDPRLRRVTGTLRIEITNGKVQRWLVSVDKGDVSVSRRGGKADCVVRGSREVLDGIVAGTINAQAAVLRGTLTVEGDPELLLLFQRVFPAPGR
jgi:putative sterol carrier protein